MSKPFVFSYNEIRINQNKPYFSPKLFLKKRTLHLKYHRTNHFLLELEYRLSPYCYILIRVQFWNDVVITIMITESVILQNDYIYKCTPCTWIVDSLCVQILVNMAVHVSPFIAWKPRFILDQTNTSVVISRLEIA